MQHKVSAPGANIINFKRERAVRNVRAHVASMRESRDQLRLLLMKIESDKEPLSRFDRRTISRLRQRIADIDWLLEK